MMANYIGGQKINITKQVDKILKVFNINQVVIASQPETKPKQLFIEFEHQIQTIEGTTTVLTYNCLEPSPIAVEFDQTKGIYTWTDIKGVPHFSDMKPLIEC